MSKFKPIGPKMHWGNKEDMMIEMKLYTMIAILLDIR